MNERRFEMTTIDFTRTQRTREIADAEFAVKFAARVLFTELGPGGFAKGQSDEWVAGWVEAMNWLNTCMDDPARMFTIYNWRHGFVEDRERNKDGSDQLPGDEPRADVRGVAPGDGDQGLHGV